MNISILTLFPEFFESPLKSSILKRASDKGIVHYHIIDIRDFSINKHKQVDDYQYGGGPGMVMRPEPVHTAIEHAKKTNGPGRVIFLTPKGEQFGQVKAESLSKEEHLILIAGHYKGIDERIRENFIDEEISVGDYILTGGEIPILLVMDAAIRLIPDVLGNKDSADTDSFSDNLLEGPLYTRPAEFMGHKVPDVLLSGHHKNIEQWRQKRSIEETEKKRNDLYSDFLRKE